MYIISLYSFYFPFFFAIPFYFIFFLYSSLLFPFILLSFSQYFFSLFFLFHSLISAFLFIIYFCLISSTFLLLYLSSLKMGFLIFQIGSTPITKHGYRDTTCTAAIAAEVCLGQNSLMNTSLFKPVFNSVFLLLYWLPPEG